MQSCIYEGHVRHRRFEPVKREFRYRLFMLYLDLDETPGVFDGRWFWSARGPAPVRFCRADYWGDPASRSPGRCDRSWPEAWAKRRADRSGCSRCPDSWAMASIRSVSISVSIPMRAGGKCRARGAQHALGRAAGVCPGDRWRHAAPLGGANIGSPSRMHVSPFLPMEIEYRLRLNAPAASLGVHLEACPMGENGSGDRTEDARPTLDATLTLRRREIGAGSLAAMLARYPLLSMRVTAAIYWQAMRIWLRGCPTFTHPANHDEPARVCP